MEVDQVGTKTETETKEAEIIKKPESTPMDTSAEGEVDPLKPQNVATSETKAAEVATTKISKEESKEESKKELSEESKEKSTEESKEESKIESKEKPKEEIKEKSKEESKESSTPNPKRLRIQADAQKKKVVYYHHDELSIFEHGRSHPRKPFRAKLAHALIFGLGIYSEFLEPLRPRLVSMTDFGQFHSDNYISILRFVQEYMNPVVKERAWLTCSPTIAVSEDLDTWEKIAGTLKRFNLGLGADSVNSAMPGLLDYCRMYTTGTMGCVNSLMSGDADIAINWYGGMTHAKSSSAFGGCYVNDVVLAILLLLRKYKNVLVVSLDGEHCDGVEEAFYASDQVMTVSFHANPENGMFPGTGYVDDIGVNEGAGYAINVPLNDGTNDRSLLSIFEPVVRKAVAVFNPEVIVYQSGGFLLSGDRFGKFNITAHGIGECVKVVKGLNLPLLCLGGSGTNMTNTARLWAYQTAILADCLEVIEQKFGKPVEEAQGLQVKDITIPEDVAYREYFGPHYTLRVRNSNMENEMTNSALSSLKKTVLDNLMKTAKT
mmetsp:Transcript_18473/g.24128  ORF Transcript_18473/g.24128 Transcript_18473/m.24128 type:complete len:547 (+) Transcript_18473:221-1861(+)